MEFAATIAVPGRSTATSLYRARGQNVTSAQFDFGPDELMFIGKNFIHLDHNEKWDGSAGIAYKLNHDSDHPTLFTTAALVQGDLRASTDTIPNGIALPRHGVLNLSVVQRIGTRT